MIKLMKKIPAGTILIPMFISALITTFKPDLFKIGGSTELLFSDKLLPFVLAVITFVSGIGIDLKLLSKILKRQGILILIRIIMILGIGKLVLVVFGDKGFLGISALAIILALMGTNPGLYIGICEDLDAKDDALAFALLGLLTLPMAPLFVYGILNSGGSLNVTELLSSLLPLVLGIVWGNLDKEARKFFAPMLSALMPFLGFTIGASMNLLGAFKSGLTGAILVVLFYLVTVPILVFVERKLLKTSGVSAVAMCAVPGLMVSLPLHMQSIYPNLIPYAKSATEQLSLCMVVSAVMTPILSKYIKNTYHKRKR